MRGSLALRRTSSRNKVSPEVECIMKKVLILSVTVLVFSMQAALAQGQGKGPSVDAPNGSVASDHSNGSKKEQPEATGDPQTPDPPADQAEQKISTSTAIITTLDGTGDAKTATSDAPVKATPTVPVAGPAPSASPTSSAGPTKSAASTSKIPDDSSKKASLSPAAKDIPAAKDAATNKNGSATKDGAAALSSPAAKANPALTGPTSIGSTSNGPISNGPIPGGPTSTAPASAATAPVASSAPLPTSLYRIGAGDVLDIRLLNASERESTLFTVMPGGLLEYPLAGAPLQVAGLTTDEVAAHLRASVKVYDNPQFIVGVREYMSHSVIVTGLVDNAGSRILRREAMPLFVVLAEAQPRAEAARATIMRAGSPSITIDLADSAATSTLVQSGDVIKVMAAPPAQPQFYFIGGQVNSPGQKDFHAGLTLTQAILASGGVSRLANNKVKVSRQGADGRLNSTEYNLKDIEDGKIPDPAMQPGDRVEVGRGR